jgi:hypothetical protein
MHSFTVECNSVIHRNLAPDTEEILSFEFEGSHKSSTLHELKP